MDQQPLKPPLLSAPRKAPPRPPRRGLAPLEFVLWLPVFLFVTALMVNLGTMQAWRIRGEIVARDAAWRARWPRTGESEPRPVVRIWPQDAAMALAGTAQLDRIDDPRINHPVARGPLPHGFQVNDHLDPRQGMYRGLAEIERRFPMLPKIGEYRSGEISHPLLDRRWSAAEMRIPNETRRTLVLYEMPKTDPALPKAYLDAVIAMINEADWAALSVLDRDPDVRRYAGGRDFHPRVNASHCTLDVEDVYESEVKRLIDVEDSSAEGGVRLGAISRLPRTMTEFFLRMYQSAKQQLEQQVEDMQQQIAELQGGTGNQQQIAMLQNQIQSAQAEIASLEPKIEALEAYRGRLREIEEALKEAFLESTAAGGSGGAGDGSGFF